MKNTRLTAGYHHKNRPFSLGSRAMPYVVGVLSGSRLKRKGLLRYGIHRE